MEMRRFSASPINGNRVPSNTTKAAVSSSRLLPSKKVPDGVMSTRKYKQIVSSIHEIGLIEPLSVIQHDPAKSEFVLLDGHLRIEVLKQLGVDLEVFESRLNELLGDAQVIIDWEMALRALREATGMPVLVGLELAPEGAAEAEGKQRHRQDQQQPQPLPTKAQLR